MSSKPKRKTKFQDNYPWKNKKYKVTLQYLAHGGVEKQKTVRVSAPNKVDAEQIAQNKSGLPYHKAIVKLIRRKKTKTKEAKK